MLGENKNLVITVVGLGYVGLPTALAFHEQGFTVIGVDNSSEKIEMLEDGIDPLVDATADNKIPINSSSWKVTTDYLAAIPESDIVIITVPTPTFPDKSPNLEYVKSASKSVLESLNLEGHTTVVLESTVYPGVTRKTFVDLSDALGLVIGDAFDIAYCPERVSPGDVGRDVSSVARVVGSDNEQIGKMLADLYSTITDEGCQYVGRIEVAEAAKMVENVQRDIDIALSNELAIVLSQIGVDVEEVLAAADTKWNFHRHTPGIGVGGHCIPVDPYYYISLSKQVGHTSKLSIAAREMNESMPSEVIKDVMIHLGNKPLSSRKILLLGFSYKPEVGDIRETPARELGLLLSKSGVDVMVWDPFVEAGEIPSELRNCNDPYQEEGVDMILLATAHNEIVNLDWEKMKKICNYPLIYDGRRVLDRDYFESNGWKFGGVGVPIFD